jgi:hypothetical protein
VQSIGSDSEITSYIVSATALTYAFFEEDGSVVSMSSEESQFGFFSRKTAACSPDMAIASPLQIRDQWLGFLHGRQSFLYLSFSCSDAGTPFKASS